MKKLFLFTIILFSSTTTFAVNKSDGCGIANEIYPDISMVGITSRSSTRQSYSSTLDWTATTSGKFGCAKHSIVNADKKSIHFLNVNHDEVFNDAANGGGEYLLGLSRTMGCKDAVYGDFANEIQTNFIHIFEIGKKNQDQSGTLNNIKSIIKKNNKLIKNCQTV